jgi:hypothetical protein
MNHLQSALSLESLRLEANIQELILTSTKNQATDFCKNINKDRRKAILPTPHRTSNIQSIANITKHNEEDILESSQRRPFQNQQYSTDGQIINQTENNKINSSNENIENSQSTNTEDNFDSFILQQFHLFSGSLNVNDWLDETEKKFHELKISRNLRFEAISSLVEDDAKRLYIKHRRDIKSFDDFFIKICR